MLETLRLFASLCAAVFIEAAPFLLLGSFVSALLEDRLKPETVARWVPKRPLPAALCGLLGGMLLPTCECGVVPITRRLLAKGVPPAAALTYMLASPIINPVVLLATAAAFGGDWTAAAFRAGLAVLPALTVGLAVATLPAAAILRPPKRLLGRMGEAGPDARGPDENGCGCGLAHDAQTGRFIAVCAHAGLEFLDMSKYLLLGAATSALFKTFIPAGIVEPLAGNVALAVPTMLALAVLLSVCSEADAFVAASFVAFPFAAKLGFLALGPMLDLKLIPTYLGTFNRRICWTLFLVPALEILVLCLAWGFWSAA